MASAIASTSSTSMKPEHIRGVALQSPSMTGGGATANQRLSQSYTFPVADWQRIQESLSKPTRDADLSEINRSEREALRNMSKNMVKNWTNTIAGLRQKKLEARTIREQKDEEERRQIDIKEAKYQAEKRKVAIDKAKMQQYFQIDRVKKFHGALLLADVLKERDKQIELKRAQASTNNARENVYLEEVKRRLEEEKQKDLQTLQERLQARKEAAEAQAMQRQIKQEKLELERVKAAEEGKETLGKIKTYLAVVDRKAEKKKQEKLDLMLAYRQNIRDKEQLQLIEKQQLDEEEMEMHIFAKAKQKIAEMRKEKELELYKRRQEQREKMVVLLAEQLKKKAGNEEQRLARAVEKLEGKYISAEKLKQEKWIREEQEMTENRISQVKEKERLLAEEYVRAKEGLLERRQADMLFHAREQEKKQQKLQVEQELEENHKRMMVIRKAKEMKVAAQEGVGGGSGPLFPGRGGQPDDRREQTTQTDPGILEGKGPVEAERIGEGELAHADVLI
ncbi:PREDICTED: coiled-coil domain-containing protein 173-like [Priapulus caudatus]|uniref:Coiled-coil domain-containing protein 173-like n=1 Tax=Priapulus caudatus TaxID=37621 RepID=A0ABM1DSA6_PRICU|nr:PREDICTED: coiled-coil domain-containing protein 173-like [Priapulus caudatus]